MKYKSTIKKIKRLTYLSFYLLLLSLNLSAQENLNNDVIEQISFIKHINDSGKSRGVTVEEVTDGSGYILTGYTNNGEYGGEDIFLIKTDLYGDTIWRKTYGGKGNDYGWAVRQTDDGGFVIVGYTNSFGKGGMDVYLIKTDSKGNTIWTKTFGNKGDEFGWDIRICKDKSFVIAAQTSNIDNGNIDAYLIKVDAEGNEKWSKTFGGDKVDRIFSVQQTQDDGYVAAGITYSYNSIGPKDRDGYILKTDAYGNQEWFKTFGEDAYDVAHAIALTNDDGYLITGYGESFATYGNRDVYLMKIHNNGETQWTKVYGGIGEERGIKGEQTKDGGYIAIGYTATDRNMYLIKTNGLGDTLWTRTFGNKDKTDFGYTVKETNDNGYIMLGHSESFDSSKGNILLIKTNSEGLLN